MNFVFEMKKKISKINIHRLRDASLIAHSVLFIEQKFETTDASFSLKFLSVWKSHLNCWRSSVKKMMWKTMKWAFTENHPQLRTHSLALKEHHWMTTIELVERIFKCASQSVLWGTSICGLNNLEEIKSLVHRCSERQREWQTTDIGSAVPYSFQIVCGFFNVPHPVIRELKATTTRPATKSTQIYIFDNKKQYFCTLCTCVFSFFWHFVDVLVLPTAWNDLFCTT